MRARLGLGLAVIAVLVWGAWGLLAGGSVRQPVEFPHKAHLELSGDGGVSCPSVVADVEVDPEEFARVRRLRAAFSHLGVIALVSLSTPEVRAAQSEGSFWPPSKNPLRWAAGEGREL